MGLVNVKDLLKLENSQIVNGIPKLEKPKNPVCGPCQIGKQIRVSHKNQI